MTVHGAVMVCGTSSNAGKSVLVAGLCRVLARRGVSVAPFKGQNMSLNSVVTSEGLEIGRAQGAQAEAAGVPPEVAMNPVLLKPVGERRSQVMVLGRPWGVLGAAEYHRAKPELRGVVLDALADLRSRHDVVILEGAGSPAEINLLAGDLVNLGLAEAAGVPAVVVGDIDRGGVFAHLFGTVELLPPGLRSLVRGFVINKLRGDPALLGDGPATLKARTGVPVLGVVPWLEGLSIDAEDSLSLSTDGAGERPTTVDGDVLDVAVLRFPRVSNFTDLDALRAEPSVSVRFVGHGSALGDPDLVVLPGTKATVADLDWLRGRGLAGAIERLRRAPRPPVVLGICGGYQMLGRRIVDRAGVEAAPGEYAGLGLLDVETAFDPEKRTRRRGGVDRRTGLAVSGYEIHHGTVHAGPGQEAWLSLETAPGCVEEEGVALEEPGVFGTTLHGLFENDAFRSAFLNEVAERRGKRVAESGVVFAQVRAAEVERVADACERHLELRTLWAIAGEAR